jgi:hypothetical protein
MPIVNVQALQCAVCGHVWLPENGLQSLPAQCPVRTCRSRNWNGTAPREQVVVKDEYSQG